MSGTAADRRSTVTIATLGCKLNQFESEAILAQFRLAGYKVVDNVEAADVGVVNTCAVTSTAERKGRSLLRSIHRRNPHSIVLAVGCLAERTPDTLAAIEGVNAVLGNREKEHIFDFLPDDATCRVPAVHIGETSRTERFDATTSVAGLLGRTRAFLKVQDGCSQKCTYCIIPQLRGKGRSLKIPQVVDQACRLADQGFAELVITGVALGTYGDDLGLVNGLSDLLRALSSVRGLQRIRLGSVEPWAVTDSLIEAIADSPVICPHLHIPLQSAADTILRRMNRRYTVGQINRMFEYAYSMRKDWGFGADIITGFPGEQDAEFKATRSFLADSPLAYLHVFPFSVRPNTPALKLPDHISENEKKNRVAALRALDNELRLRFRKSHLGARLRVLFEKRFAGDLLAGHAANYLDVYSIAEESLPGTIQEVLITQLHPAGVVGEVIP